MMRKKCFIGIMVAFCICFIATSCSKSESNSQQEITDSFIALVMGGKSIDPNQTWTTATTMPIKVSVDMEANTQYRVFFYLSNPSSDPDACYVGMARLKSGESRTIYVNAPAGTTQLYAACFAEGGQTAICKPLSGSEVNFSGNITSSTTVTPTSTTGNNWSVPIKNMPSTTKYTSGTMIAPEDIDPDLSEDAELRIKISNDYKGIVAALTNHTNLSIYVTGSWTLTFDQRFINGNVLVVGNGGKIIVPNNFKLTTAPQFGNSSPGVIYVLPGGEISGEGAVEFTDGQNLYSYNAGTITCKEIRLSSGSLYNSGTIGSSTGSKTIITGEATVENTPGQFFNYGNAYLMQTSGNSLAFHNANKINVSGALSLSSSSRMDDGSVIECNSISFYNTDNSDNVLYMGNGSYLNCSGAASFRNYGIWGPSGNNYHDNALVSFSSCINCNHTYGNPYTYLLDHVQLMLPATFQDYDKINGWINGSGGGIETSRQTCYYAYTGNSSPAYNSMYYAFEVPSKDDIKDFDYNDLILQVSTPYDNGDGTYTSYFSVAAIGTEMSVYLYHNGTQIGKEIHEVMNIDKEKTVNTTTVTTLPRYIGEVTSNSSEIYIGNLSFSVQISKSDGTSVQTLSQPATNQAPLYIAVNADSQGKWRWCREGTNIGLAFLKFSLWAADQQTATDWYYSTYTSSSHIIPSW